ncbi:hypothetical protein BJV78DRAFT_223539 [Lactifluus subvellereus]|nr:hypothetical protein BJV78DRAFT_223539 [Lactifluus subvellereus]
MTICYPIYRKSRKAGCPSATTHTLLWAPNYLDWTSNDNSKAAMVLKYEAQMSSMRQLNKMPRTSFRILMDAFSWSLLFVGGLGGGVPTWYPSSLTDVVESYGYADWSAQYMYQRRWQRAPQGDQNFVHFSLLRCRPRLSKTHDRRMKDKFTVTSVSLLISISEFSSTIEDDGNDVRERKKSVVA